MTENLIRLKRCEQCEHYQEHYILISKGRVMSEIQCLDKGHCKRKRPNHRLMYAWDSCDEWEENEELKGKERKWK